MSTVTGICERARAWVSLQADGELSELEQALLAAHLDRCAACASFAAGVRGFESALRSQPLEPLPRPITLRRAPSGTAHRFLQIGAAVAVVATGGLGALVAGVFHATSEPTAAPLQRVSVVGDESPRTMRELRRIVLVAELPRASRHVLDP